MSNNSQHVGPTYAGTIDISPTTPVFNLPTKNIFRSGIVDASSFSVLNIIGGLIVVIDVSTLINAQTLLLLASGGVSATVTLSNSGTIAGSQYYTLKPGNFLSVQFDGTNLVE